jgi:hypothetical protein
MTKGQAQEQKREENENPRESAHGNSFQDAAIVQHFPFPTQAGNSPKRVVPETKRAGEFSVLFEPRRKSPVSQIPVLPINFSLTGRSDGILRGRTHGEKRGR